MIPRLPPPRSRKSRNSLSRRIRWRRNFFFPTRAFKDADRPGNRARMLDSHGQLLRARVFASRLLMRLTGIVVAIAISLFAPGPLAQSLRRVGDRARRDLRPALINAPDRMRLICPIDAEVVPHSFPSF